MDTLVVMKPETFAPRKLLSLLLLSIGIVLIACGSALPFVASDGEGGKGGLGDVAAAIVFVTLPCLLGGSLIFLQGWMRLRTRIRIAHDGVDLRVPTWAGGCYPPLRSHQLTWSDVQSIDVAECSYGAITALTVIVDEFTLRTTHGTFTVTRAFCPKANRLVEQISEQTGVPIVRCPGQQRCGWWRKPDH